MNRQRPLIDVLIDHLLEWCPRNGFRVDVMKETDVQRVRDLNGRDSMFPASMSWAVEVTPKWAPDKSDVAWISESGIVSYASAWTPD